LAKEFLSAGAWVHCTWFTETSCCHPDTMISIPGDHTIFSNCNVKIKDLVGRENFPVYCFDLEEQRFRIGTCKKVWETKIAKKLIAITLDDGNILKLTPDHLVMNYDGEYVRADQLQINNRLMAMHFRHNVMIKDFSGNWEDESRLVGEWIAGRKLTKNEHVDHLDSCRLDNRPEMLQILTSSEHAKKTHKNNEQSKLTIEKRIKSFQVYCENNKEKLSERGTNRSNKFWNEVYFNWTQEEKNEFNKNRVNSRMKVVNDKMLNDPDYSNNISKTASVKSKKFWNDFKNWTKEEQEKWLSDKNKKSEETKRKARQKEHDINGKNHKIVNIELIEEITPVYDMEVEKYHNFIANGVVIHNCISSMEIQAAGARLISSSIAALNETVGSRGILLDGVWTDKSYQDKFVEETVKALKNNDNSDRLVLQKYAQEHFGLDQLAKDWENMFFSLINELKVNPLTPYQPTKAYR
jgi:hypothetical protein